MTRIIMNGCNGKMGQCISGIVAKDPECEIVAGIDVFDDGHNAYPVFDNISKCDTEADCLIDFSTAKAVDEMLDYCVAKKLPCVLCTTGLSEAQIEKAKEASKTIPVLKSANMSLGINMLGKVLKEISAVLAQNGFDIEIVEKHHNLKLDSPSGTALYLADSVNESLPEKYEYVYDRSQRREKRPVNEIGISAVRGGTIVGDHDVLFAGEDEVITFSHRAYSKAVFGKGAVCAAKFLKDAKPGYYDMSDVINA